MAPQPSAGGPSLHMQNFRFREYDYRVSLQVGSIYDVAYRNSLGRERGKASKAHLPKAPLKNLNAKKSQYDVHSHHYCNMLTL